MFYRAKIEADKEGGYIATFGDVPAAITGADTKEEAHQAARDALETILLQLACEGSQLPEAMAKSGTSIYVSPQVACKIAVISAFKAANISKTELAARLGKKEGEARRILDPFHMTKLVTLEETLNAFGKRLVISVEAAE